MYSLACSGLNSRRKKGEYEGQKSAARSHIVYIGAITHMRDAMRKVLSSLPCHSICSLFHSWTILGCFVSLCLVNDS